MLVALPQAQILSLDGFMRAIETASERVGAGWITTLVAGLIVVLHVRLDDPASA